MKVSSFPLLAMFVITYAFIISGCSNSQAEKKAGKDMPADDYKVYIPNKVPVFYAENKSLQPLLKNGNAHRLVVSNFIAGNQIRIAIWSGLKNGNRVDYDSQTVFPKPSSASVKLQDFSQQNFLLTNLEISKDSYKTLQDWLRRPDKYVWFIPFLDSLPPVKNPKYVTINYYLAGRDTVPNQTEIDKLLNAVPPNLLSKPNPSPPRNSN